MTDQMIASCVIQKSRGQNFTLSVDGLKIAGIDSTQEECRFAGAVACRVTRVSFADLSKWTIKAVEPGPLPAGGVHPITDRVVTVFENQRSIASAAFRYSGAAFAGDSDVDVLVGDRHFTLSPARKAKVGTIDGHATLSKSRERGDSWRPKPTWTLSTTELIPLSIVILHWHILIGDWKEPDRMPTM